MAGEIQAAFNSVYEDGPSSTPDQPSKPRIRNELAPVIQGQVDEIRSLATTAVQWKEPVRAASTENVDITTGLENGDVIDGVTLATGDRVLLKNQATAGQNGVYVVVASGAASRSSDANEADELVGLAVFVRSGTVNGGKQFACSTPAPITVGTTSLTFTEVSDQSALNATLSGKVDKAAVVTGYTVPLIFDPKGVLGVVRTAYLGRDFYRRQGSGLVNLANFGSDSTRIPGVGYTQVQWPDDAQLYLIYIDTDDIGAGYKVALHSAIPTSSSGKIIAIASVWRGKVQDCDYDYRYAEDVQGQFFARVPIILDDGNLRMPRYAWANSEVSVNTASGGTDVYPYGDVSFPASGVVAQSFSYDHTDKLRGGSGFVVSSYPADPQNPYVYPLLSSYFGGVGLIGGVPAVGDGVPGTILPNLMACGKNSPEDVSHVIGIPSYVDIADATLNALGFTRGFRAATSGNVYLGTKILDAQAGRYGFFRIFALADNDTDLGILNNLPRVFWAAEGAGSVSEPMVLAKKHSARVYEFVGFNKMPSGSAPFVAIAIGANVNAGRTPIFTVPQIGYGGGGMSYVKATDYPTEANSKDEKLRLLYEVSKPYTEAELLHSAHIWGIEGRPIPFYPQNMLQISNEGSGHVVSLTGADSTKANKPIGIILPDHGADILPEELPPAVDISFRLKAAAVKGARQHIVATRHLVAPSVLTGKSPVVLCIGDSLIEYSGTAVALKRKLEALGVTPNFLGTITGIETTVSGGTVAGQTAPCEGRRTRTFADYVHIDTANMAPVTDWSAYMALTSDQRRAYNPFLVASSGTYARNGYAFDMDHYLTTASYPDPQFVFINLGTNDYFNAPDEATAYAQVQDAMTIMYNQTRAALPNAIIVFVTNSMVWNDLSVGYWNRFYGPLIRQILEFVKANASDNKLFALDNHARISREFGFQYLAGATDGKGVQAVTMNNDLHYAGIGHEQWAEQALALIANRV